jgi:hypothetical protein
MIVPLALLAMGSYMSASTYYVATDGSDYNPGTANSPFQTLQQGVNMAGPGDTVVVRDGTYGPNGAWTGGDGSDFNASAVVLVKSGAPDAWITIQAEHKGGAVLDCQMQCDSYIDLYNSSYVEIRGFVITQGYKEGMHSNDSAHHITLRGNRIEYIANRWTSTRYGQNGLYTNRHCHDFFIDGNVFHDIGRLDWGAFDHALYLHGSNFTITNNLFYNISRGWSIQAADGLTNVTIANNTFAFANAPGQEGQIMLWNTQTNLYIVNNIFYSAANWAIARYDSNVNNCVIDHNLVYGSYGMLSDSQGCNETATMTWADPNFVNVQYPYDFGLQWNSPAIGAGVPRYEVPTDINGNPRSPGPVTDLGAYAF